MLVGPTAGRFIRWDEVSYCFFDRSGHYMGCGAESSAHRQDRLWETMEQVIDEPDECVLSTDQLTLMRLWLLLAKYFPPLIFSHACVLLLFPFALLSSHILRWKSRVIVVAVGSSLCILQKGEIFIRWDMGMLRCSLPACGRGMTFLFP